MFIDKNVRFRTPMLGSDLCDYSSAYFFVKGTINFLFDAANEHDKAQTDVVFKNNGTFRSRISKINNTLIEVTIPLKYLCNFWRSFNLPLINFEIELDISWKLIEAMCIDSALIMH